MYINKAHFEAIEAAMSLLPHDDPKTADIVKNAEAAIADLHRQQQEKNQTAIKIIQERRKIDPNYARGKKKS